MTTIRISELDETLVTLGLLVGFFGQPAEENDANEVAIRTEWFNDPLSEIRNITSGGNDRLFELLGQVFEKDAAENGETQTEREDWYAITYPGDDGEPKKTPLYIVHKLKKDDAGAVISDLIGFGCKIEHGTSVIIRPYLFFSVTDMGAIIAGTSDYPIEVGVEIKRGSGSGATFGTKAVSFTGLRLSLKIHFDRTPEISDIMLFGLALGDGISLPGVEEGQSEVGLIGLFAGVPDQLEEWMEFVFELILTEVSDEDTDLGSLRPVLNNLRLLLGLSEGVPGIDWSGLTSAPDEVLKKWLAQIIFEEASCKTWLNALQCLLDGKDGTKTENTDALQGKGSVAQPYALHVLSSWAGSSFAVTFALDEQRNLSLGLHLESETYELAHGIGVQFVAKVDAGPFLISQNDIHAEKVLPAFDLSIHVRNPGANPQNLPPLFSYIPYPPLPPLPGEPETKPPPDTHLTIGALQAGVSVSFVGGPQAPSPSLLFTDVTLGDDNFDLNLLTLKKREPGAAEIEPFAADFTADNLRILLKVLGEALQDAWDRYQPSRYASLETNIERIVRGDDYKSIIDKLLQLSGQQVSDIPALLVELGEWIADANVEDLPRQALDWLVVEGNVFGLLGGLLSVKIQEFSGAGQLLSYAPWQDFSVSLGKETSDGPFGMWLRPAAELAAITLSGEVAVVFTGFDDPPALTAVAHIGLGDTSLVHHPA